MDLGKHVGEGKDHHHLGYFPIKMAMELHSYEGSAKQF